GAVLQLTGEASFSETSDLDVDGTLRVLGGATTLNGSADIADLNVQSGTMVIADSSAVNNLLLTGGTLEILGGASLSSVDVQGGVLVLAGDVEISASFAQTAGTIQLVGGATLDLSAFVLTGASISGSDANDFIDATGSGDTVFGGAGADRLAGWAGEDWLSGESGADTLIGGGGRDTLTAGDGADLFVFDILETDENSDLLIDFAGSGLDGDTIQLRGSVFSSIGLSLTANEFAFGTQAQDGDDRIVYDQSEGILYYDSNGNVDGGQVLLATLANRADLSVSDFQII
ncbi:calcium-binding protein, partial [Rhizobium sp. M1]|uniref:calcium-binding protein n=1 Tax=Rhizobium sp. M1 TaxID=2035453 RepID=UPI000BEB7AFF